MDEKKGHDAEQLNHVFTTVASVNLQVSSSAPPPHSWVGQKALQQINY